MNTSNKPFRKGDRVRILPEYQDPGDEKYTWVVLADEEKGRVDILPTDIPLHIKPRSTVQTTWILHVS